MTIKALAAGTRQRPRRPALDHRTAMRLAQTEYERVADAVEALEPAQWTLPTDCPEWDVRAMVAHICGMAAMNTTPWETNRQMKAAKREVARTGAQPVDALTGLQVSERADRTPEQLIAELRAVGPKAARARRRIPSIIRNRRLPEEQSMEDLTEWWTIGYLTDIVLTRDPWMHRVDLSRATGNEMVLTREHDGVLIDDVVRDWAGRHGQPYRLHLTGPAGGTWSAGDGGEEYELDAVEFCRTLSGRARGEGLLSGIVPF